MVARRFTNEQIIASLNEADAGVITDNVSGLKHFVGLIMGQYYRGPKL
jgi:hypothetical protein